MNRRAFLATGALSAAALAGSVYFAGRRGAGHFAAPDGAPLRDHAGARGLRYGCAVRARHLAEDPAFAALVTRECAVLVPENELKWEALRPTPDRFDFTAADAVLAFAERHAQAVRGHALVWHSALPAWFAGGVTTRAQAEAALRGHVAAVVGRYAGRIGSWDVVNEAVEPGDGRADGLRVTPWLRLIGPEYLSLAFHLAAEADARAELVYNENWIELDDAGSDRKRGAVLERLARMRADRVPVHALGVQAHLRAERARGGPERLSAFLGEVASLGMKVLVTEMDVADSGLSGDVARRDAEVAAVYHDYLAAVLDQPAVTTVLTWGLSDRYTWLSRQRPRADRLPVRPLPFDAELRPKPARHAIARAFDAAPRR